MLEFTKIQKKRLQDIAAKTPSIQLFEDDNPAKKAKRVEAATGDGWAAFSFAAKTYFPHVTTKRFCDAHRETLETIEQNVDGLTAITGFRGLSKTVLFGPVYEIWKLMKGELYIVNIASDQDSAEERNSFIFYEMSNNRRIKNDFPELKVTEGDEADFYTKNGARVRARSIRQFSRGTINPKNAARPGLIDCDDIDKEDNIGNWTIGRRKKDKIQGEIFGSKDPSRPFRVLWKGNLTHPNFSICQFEDDLSEEIKSAEPNSKPDERKHLISGKKIMLRFPVEDKNGKSVWPKQYSDETLVELRKTMGMVSYLREMIGRKIIEGKIFKWEWFNRWRKLPEKKGCYARLYADLAPGEKNCYKAFLGGFRFENKYYVTHTRVRQEKNSAFFQAYYTAFEELTVKFGLRFRAYVEANFDQYRGFCRDFDLFCQMKGLSSITHKIRKYNNTGKKTERIESLETIIEQSKIWLPDGQDSKTLIEQFLAYPDGYLDGPDATEGWLQQFPGYNPRRCKARVRRI